MRERGDRLPVRMARLPESAIQIQTNESEITIEADAFHFTNLVYNLMDNSIKYCNSKPEIIIKITKTNSNIILEFIDNGIGINNENIKRIFDKFYRIKTSKTNEVNGFGLGLYYVKKICDLHKWKIDARSNDKQGITISIII